MCGQPFDLPSVRGRTRRSLMAMVCGLDLHRRQITFDALEVDSGKEWRGRIWQPDRDRFRRWLSGDLTRRAKGGPVALAVEGCTWWRYVVEEIEAAGFEANLAEPADTQATRGRKHRAKTDAPTPGCCGTCSPGSCRRAGSHPRACSNGGNGCGCTCRWSTSAPCGASGSTPSSISTAWRCPKAPSGHRRHGPCWPTGHLALSPAGRQRITVGYRMIAATDAEAPALVRKGGSKR